MKQPYLIDIAFVNDIEINSMTLAQKSKYIHYLNCNKSDIESDLQSELDYQILKDSDLNDMKFAINFINTKIKELS